MRAIEGTANALQGAVRLALQDPLGPVGQTRPQRAVIASDVPRPPGLRACPPTPALRSVTIAGPPRPQPKLLDRLREALRSRHYSRRTEQCYWQWVFPQENRWVNTRTGAQGRHHVLESIPQKAVKAAVRKAGIPKHATCHTFRHSGVYPALCGTTHLLEAGYLSAVPACASPHADRPSTAQAGDIRTVPVRVRRTGRQELLGHKDVKTTMIYTHVLNRGGKGVRIPVDAL